MTIIPTLPVTLQNGTIADATQVMADFLAIVNSVNANAAHSGANSDITSLTGLTTPLAIFYGGTGAATATGARTNLGAASSGVNSDITSLSGLTTPLAVSEGGTAGTTASATTANNIGAAALGANSDITSLSGLTTPLSVSQGGTGRNDGLNVGTAVVSFNSSGTITGVSLNVSSVSRLSAGEYQVNFSTPFANTNYCPVAVSTNSGGIQVVVDLLSITTSSCTIVVQNRATGVGVDAACSMIVFGA